MRVSGIGTNPMTAAASEAALKLVKDVVIPPISPPVGTPVLVPPPATAHKLGDEMSTVDFFRNLVDHYETADWVNVLHSSVEVRGNFYSKKLADYVFDKLGIDVEDAVSFTADGTNFKIVAAAGVKLVFLVIELLARNALWDRMPYIRFLLASKFTTDSEDHKKAKRNLIDALSLYDADEPKLFGDTYSGIFQKEYDAMQGRSSSSFNTYILPASITPVLTPKEIVSDILRGMVSHVSGIPDPDVTDPTNVASVLVSNLKEVDTKFKCAEHGVRTIAEACWAWIDRQPSPTTIPVGGSILEYAEIARKMMPAFIAVFA
jgi:hypothetical protein